MTIKDYSLKVRGFIAEWGRVLRITKKPDRATFRQAMIVTGMGIICIGTIGFLINLLFSLGGLKWNAIVVYRK